MDVTSLLVSATFLELHFYLRCGEQNCPWAVRFGIDLTCFFTFVENLMLLTDRQMCRPCHVWATQKGDNDMDRGRQKGSQQT